MSTERQSDVKWHELPCSSIGIPLPKGFTYPFHYTPHPLVRIAAEQTQEYLRSRADWHDELRKGKMFGVLIVRAAQGDIGFLAAFSGNLAGSNQHAFFVPPIYDLLQPDGFFRKEESLISEINHRIAELETSEAYRSAQESLETVRLTAGRTLAERKNELKAAKQRREQQRSQGLPPEDEARLIKESQFQKAEFKRLEKRLKQDIAEKEEALNGFDARISEWKHERKSRSAALQKKLFEQFRILNARGEVKDLCQLFADTPQGVPPAGTGECALPKLLQYAYLNGYQPLAMGEFWWGESPKDEIRKEGNFYPSCKSKCAPILRHALVGLNVDANPLAEDKHRETPLDIIYEDPWIVAVNKPAGMLSVPGKDGLDSVLERLRTLYPEVTGPLVVHRLDMDTSGILLAAKDKATHQELQAQFETKRIRKTYTAIVEGTVDSSDGIISLPLCPNPDDRPRQMVSHEYGKTSVSLYKVLKRSGGKTLLSLSPQTGRTHQLRVHAAHPEGLGHPIVGDPLYGTPSDRMYLHATELSFTHPITGKRIHIRCNANFSL